MLKDFLLLLRGRQNNTSTFSPSMASPPIPRSKSAPDITSPSSPFDSSVPPSGKSVRSTLSTGSPVITSLPKKLTDLIKTKTRNSGLTQDRLEEFNRKNALIEARYNSSSPYYKGLTDFSLVINREKLSDATSFVSTSSRSSFVVKVQEWGSSCFTSRTSDKSVSSSITKSTSSTRSSHDTRFITSSSSSSTSKIKGTGETVTKIRTKTTANDMETPGKKVIFSLDTAVIPSTMEKPLRERNSVPLPMLLVPQPAASPPESLPYPLPEVTTPSNTQPLSSAPPPPPPPPVQESTQQTPPPDCVPAPMRILYEREEKKLRENERKYVWADRYRPVWLQDFLCNKRTALWLQSMVRGWRDQGEECGHFIFEGKPGVGKRTMIWALLREAIGQAFGQDKLQAREECKKFYLKGESVGSILVNLMVSPQHIEVNLSELNGYEKHVIVELMKEESEKLKCNYEDCKALILYEADKLSTDALSYIKWMLEKFKGCNKVFFCCSDASKLQAIKPLCTFVQLLEPSNDEILEVLAFIAEQEGIHLPIQLTNKMAINSKNNLRQAIRSFEATWHFNGCCSSLEEDQDIKTGWEDKIANIAQNVVEEQSPKQLYKIRGELQNLIEHNVAPEFIFQTLKEELKKILPQQLQPQFDSLFDEYQNNHASLKYFSSAHQQEELGKRQNDQKRNVQHFMRIEEFIARFMSWYKGLKNKGL